MSRKLFGLIATLITACFIVPSFASAQVVFVNPAKVKSPQVGENIEITVQVKEIKNLLGIEFDLLFDPTVLKNDTKGTKQGDFLKKQAFFLPPQLKDGRLKDTVLTMLGREGADCEAGAECILAYFRFEVLEVRVSEIKLDAVKALSSEEDEVGNPVEINVALEHCSITTVDPTTDVRPAGILPITWGRIKKLLISMRKQLTEALIFGTIKSK